MAGYLGYLPGPGPRPKPRPKTLLDVYAPGQAHNYEPSFYAPGQAHNYEPSFYAPGQAHTYTPNFGTSWAEMFTQGQEPGWWDKLPPAQKTQYNMMYNAFNDGSQLIAPPVYDTLNTRGRSWIGPTPAKTGYVKGRDWGWVTGKDGRSVWIDPELDKMNPEWRDQMRDYWGWAMDDYEDINGRWTEKDLTYDRFKDWGYEHGLRWVDGGFNPFGGTEGWSRLDKYGQPAGTNTLGDRQFRIRTR